jgi:hypothetical protein
MNDDKRLEKVELPSMSAWLGGQFGLDAVHQFWEQNQAIATALVDWNSEVLHFVSQRSSQNGETVRKMAQCQNWAETLDIEAQWLRKAFDDYLKETSKLIEFNSKIIGRLTEVTGGVGAQPSAAKVPMRAAS